MSRYTVLRAVLFFTFAMLLLGQTPTAQVAGLITDPSGAVIQGAQIAVTNEETGIKRDTKSNDAGYYTVPLLQRGKYQITVQKEGFKPITRSGITLAVAEVARIDFTLEVGAITERVTVSAPLPAIETERPTISSVVTREQFSQLPFNGRDNLGRLFVLAPGVQQSYGNIPNVPGTTNFGGVMQTVDGAPSMNEQNGFPQAATPSFDNIQEFRFISNTASAEYSQGMVQVVVVTRTGTNQYHGDVFWFNRNRAFASKYVLNHGPLPPYNRNEFGASAGGPIRKDKLFFFGGFEALRSISRNQPVWDLPTRAMKGGNFAGLAPITDPTTGQAFSDNMIPPSQISSVSARLQEFYPEPNRPGVGPAGTGGNFMSLNAATKKVPRYSGRVDYQPRSTDSIFGRVSVYNEGPWSTGGGGPNYGSSNWRFRERSVTLGYTKSISPGLINEFRWAYSRFIQGTFADQNQDFDPESVIPQLAGQCCGELTDMFKTNPGRFVNGLPSVNISGYTGLWDAQGDRFLNRDLSFTDGLTYVRSRHQLKFGGYVHAYHYVGGGTTAAGRGQFTFTGRYTGNGYADFLLGDISQSVRAPAYSTSGWTQKRFGSFIQDDWQVSRGLTLNLGLRWDVMNSFHEDNGMQGLFDPAKNAVVLLNGSDQYPAGSITRLVDNFPYLTTAEAGLGGTNSLFGTIHQWQPRVGFAYRPLGDNRTVVRGGGGLYYSIFPQGWIANWASMAGPFQITETFDAPPGDPTITFANPFPGSGSIPQNPSTFGFARNLTLPYTAQWNLTIEREMLPNTSLRVSYVGAKLTHGLALNYDINIPRVNGPYPAGGLQSVRPYQPWGSILWWDSRLDSQVNSLQVSAVRRAADLTFQLEYQWTKALDNGTDTRTGEGYNPFDLRFERGNQNDIQRHRMAASWIYYLPIGGGRKFLSGLSAPLDYLLGGWELSGISIMRTGTPFNVWYNSGLPGYPTAVRADVVGDWRVSNPNANQWFNPAAFAKPAPYTWGNLGRYALFGPGAWNVDLGMMKNFAIREHFKLQVRSEWFNAFNHPNLGGFDRGQPRNSLNNLSTLGKIFDFSGPRTIQFGVKLSF